MFEFLEMFIAEHIVPLGFLGVFAGSFIEEIWAPIPSAVVIVTAGLAFVTSDTLLGASGQILWYVMIPASLGITLGSYLIYYLSMYFGETFIKKYGKWFGIRWSDIEKVEAKYKTENIDWWGTFILRCLPFVPNVVIAAITGLTRVPFWTYTTASILGLMVRSAIFGFIAWKSADLYYTYTDIFHTYEVLILGGAFGLIALGPLYAYLTRHKRV